MTRTRAIDFDVVASAIQGADAVSLFEGLPHPTFERETLASELAAAPHSSIADHPFYAEPLEVTSTLTSILREVLGSAAAYSPFSGEKFCGGFHPDFAIAWRSSGSVVTTLLCFGCVETLTILGNESVRADLPKHAFVVLYELLRVVREHRPGDPPPPLPQEFVRAQLNSGNGDA